MLHDFSKCNSLLPFEQQRTKMLEKLESINQLLLLYVLFSFQLILTFSTLLFTFKNLLFRFYDSDWPPSSSWAGHEQTDPQTDKTSHNTPYPLWDCQFQHWPCYKPLHCVQRSWLWGPWLCVIFCFIWEWEWWVSVLPIKTIDFPRTVDKFHCQLSNW